MQKINKVFHLLGGNLHAAADNVRSFLEKGDNRKKFLSGLKDGDFGDDKTLIKTVSIPALKLKPSQDAIYTDTILGTLISWPGLRDQILSGKVIAPDMFISNDNYIIDGHHRWATTYSLRPKSNIACTMIDLSIHLALPIINAILISFNKFKPAITTGVNIWSGNLNSKYIHEKFLEILDSGLSLGDRFINAQPDELFIRDDNSIFLSSDGKKSLDNFYYILYPQNFKLATNFLFQNLKKIIKPSKKFGSRKQMPQINQPGLIKKVLSVGMDDIADPTYSQYNEINKINKNLNKTLKELKYWKKKINKII